MKFLFEYFDVLAQAPGGVKKLREMILQFAVQGKLVQQEPNDEPASVLLEKIKAEKERLIKEGKIKKQKPLEPIREDEIPYDLPKGWVWTRLETILYITSGKNLTAEKMQEGNIPVYGGNGITGYHNAYNVGKKTLVIGRVGFYCGSIHITPERAWVTDNAFKTVFSEENIDINFLSILLSTFDLKANDNATAQPVISGKKIYPILLPLAPNLEQKRIVAKVDSLMALCDDLEKQQQEKVEKKLTVNKASLHALNSSVTEQDFNKNWRHITKNFDLLYSTPENVNDLKQTILQLAVQGKLVPQDSNDEPATVLLNKIKAEKERLVREGKIKKQKDLEPIREAEILFELPKKWNLVRLGDVIELLTDYHSNGSYAILKKNVKLLHEENYALMVRTTNFHKKNKDNFKYITESAYKFLSKSKVYPGDIIMNKIADPGRVFMVTDLGKPMSLAMNLFLLRFFEECDNNYAYFYLLQAYEYICTFISGTSTKTITKDAVRELFFPLPPFSEQKRIVAKVDSLMALCDKLSKSLTDKETKSEKMLNAVVNQLSVTKIQQKIFM